jgi:hypothetical protein
MGKITTGKSRGRFEEFADGVDGKFLDRSWKSSSRRGRRCQLCGPVLLYRERRSDQGLEDLAGGEGVKAASEPYQIR